jgi:hypothetical protein
MISKDQQEVWDVLSSDNTADFKEYRKQHRTTWLTLSRKIVLIRNMETDWIINCINMLERLEQQDTFAYSGLIEELKKRNSFLQ